MNVTLPLTITPSRFAGAAACQRRHFAEDIVCIRPPGTKAPALAFGTVLHAGAACHWKGGDWQTVLSAVEAAYAKEADLVGEEKHTLALALGLMAAYVASAKPAGEHWSTLLPESYTTTFRAIEDRVVFDLGPLAALSFQLDRLAVISSEGIEDQEHYYALGDTKSASRLDKRWMQQWPLNLQQRIYRYAAPRHYGLPRIDYHFIEGVEKKVGGGIQYVPLPDWSEATLDEDVAYLKRLVQKDAKLVADCMLTDGTVDGDLLLQAFVSKTDYDPGHCFDYGRACPLLAVCSANVTERAGMISAWESFTPTFLE